MVYGALLLAVLLGTVLLTGALIRFTTARQWLDRPLHRSAHLHPTPSAGGLGMLVPFLLGISLLLLSGALPAKAGLLFIGCLPVTLIGLLDDLKTLSIRVRLPVQVISALWVIYWVGELPSVRLGGWELDNAFLIRVLGFISFIWLLNLFNFMDGIDGLAASEAGFVTLLSCLLVITADDRVVGMVASLTCAVALGFLVWNWAPAKIFMGDTGSNFLAYVLGSLALLSLVEGSLNPWTWLLLLGIFIVDATYTLIVRMCTGQRWHEAHNSHSYQIAARRLGSHTQVTGIVLTINLLWLAPLAWFATRNPQHGLYLTLLGWMPLVLLAWRLGAGLPRKNWANPGEVG